jgi:spermidine/putrescine transport system substrate-binding protein
MGPDLPLSRRRLLARGSSALIGLALAPALAACTGRGKDGDAEAKAKRLVISTWPLYIDPGKEGVPGSVELFTKQTGIKVTYTEDINDPLAFFSRVQPDLSAGKRLPQDIIVPTYWVAQRLIDLGWVDPLPLEQIPNAANLLPSLTKPTWDPTGRFSLPWQTGITGIAYNIEATGRELRSVDDLFDPKLRGKVGFLTEMRDTIGLLMLADGQDPAKPTFAAAQGSFNRLEQAKTSGQIRAFTGNDYQDDLLAGNFAACVAWSGDVAQLSLEQPKLRFVVPESGGIRFADVMVMPKGAPHRDAAAAWMNFVYDPMNAARIAATVNYISPVQGVAEILARDPATAAMARNPLMFPDAEMERRLTVFGPLSSEEESRFDARFAEITGG